MEEKMKKSKKKSKKILKIIRYKVQVTYMPVGGTLYQNPLSIIQFWYIDTPIPLFRTELDRKVDELRCATMLPSKICFKLISCKIIDPINIKEKESD